MLYLSLHTSSFLVKRLPRSNFDFIWFSFLTSLAFIQVYVLAIATCAICFTGKISSPYKCSKELICSACVKRKRFVPVMGTTWMLPGDLKQIYIRLAVM